MDKVDEIYFPERGRIDRTSTKVKNSQGYSRLPNKPSMDDYLFFGKCSLKNVLLKNDMVNKISAKNLSLDAY